LRQAKPPVVIDNSPPPPPRGTVSGQWDRTPDAAAWREYCRTHPYDVLL
jgi:hypothetical protein